MLKLRPYQEDLLNRVQGTLAADPKARVMMQLPTGGGKTVIAGALLRQWLTGGRKTVWLTHRAELGEQTKRMLTDASVAVMIYGSNDWKLGTNAPACADGVVILMAQTVSRRDADRQIWKRYSAEDMLIIDEAHHATAAGWERAIKQWPGVVVGMTATPWRLSEREGFDHLFGKLISGPQTAELQALDEPALCQARVVVPPHERRIIGGEVGRTGDFTKGSIEQANLGREVMTAGVRDFWLRHAAGRSTIAYAVSVTHALNLTDVFHAAGVPADVILGTNNTKERYKAIDGFRDGRTKVLINVAVATEGFDLPNASCVIVARPTLSLALYLQMVGRGLRPKDDGGDCLILDLAGNCETHGLPEDNRHWSLRPSGTQKLGQAPVAACPKCGTVSPASSHQCRGCGNSLGQDCGRCGKWRAYRRWQYETNCGNIHQLVCDLCHNDAHVQAHLPTLRMLAGLYDRELEREALESALHAAISIANCAEKKAERKIGAMHRAMVRFVKSLDGENRPQVQELLLQAEETAKSEQQA